MKRINQTTVGWINYYGIANMKAFIKEIQGWLNHRLTHLEEMEETKNEICETTSIWN